MLTVAAMSYHKMLLSWDYRKWMPPFQTTFMLTAQTK